MSTMVRESLVYGVPISPKVTFHMEVFQEALCGHFLLPYRVIAVKGGGGQKHNTMILM